MKAPTTLRGAQWPKQAATRREETTSESGIRRGATGIGSEL